MATPYLSQIMMFGGNFAPRGWALCNGQLLSIQQNTALFSLIGTFYGGNGIQNFALPNLQSCLPVGFGQGPGLSNYVIGQTGGSPNVTLTQQQVPTHTHGFMCSPNASATNSPSVAGNVPGTPPASGANLYATPPGSPPLQPQALGANAVSPAGNSQGHSNLMPSLCITFCIALQGVFPTRN
jgi:microcystin-dependent protein